MQLENISINYQHIKVVSYVFIKTAKFSLYVCIMTGLNKLQESLKRFMILRYLTSSVFMHSIHSHMYIYKELCTCLPAVHVLADTILLGPLTLFSLILCTCILYEVSSSKLFSKALDTLCP